jgi:hypothetical protein
MGMREAETSATELPRCWCGRPIARADVLLVRRAPLVALQGTCVDHGHDDEHDHAGPGGEVDAETLVAPTRAFPP